MTIDAEVIKRHIAEWRKTKAISDRDEPLKIWADSAIAALEALLAEANAPAPDDDKIVEDGKMDEQLFVIHWRSTVTGATGHGTGAFEERRARSWVDALNRHKDGFKYWLEPKTDNPKEPSP